MKQKTEIIEVPVTEKWVVWPAVDGAIYIKQSGIGVGFFNGEREVYEHISGEIPEQVWKRAEELYREGQPVSGEVTIRNFGAQEVFEDISPELLNALRRPGRVKITVERLD